MTKQRERKVSLEDHAKREDNHVFPLDLLFLMSCEKYSEGKDKRFMHSTHLKGNARR